MRVNVDWIELYMIWTITLIAAVLAVLVFARMGIMVFEAAFG